MKWEMLEKAQPYSASTGKGNLYSAERMNIVYICRPSARGVSCFVDAFTKENVFCRMQNF